MRRQRHAHNRAINAAADALAAAPMPTIAAINGLALGGGCEIALACDLRYAADDAQIGLTEARIGAIPGAGGTQRLPRVIGAARALEMMLTGEPVTGRRAAEIGLVHAAVASAELDGHVIEDRCASCFALAERCHNDQATGRQRHRAAARRGARRGRARGARGARLGRLCRRAGRIRREAAATVWWRILDVSRPVSTHRSKAEHVAQQLLERIIAAKLKPGASFATEAELLAQFDVSRPTLRESIKILESQGVVERRPGPGGGIMVRQPGIDLLAHGLSVFLRLNEVPFVTVLKAREVVEPALAYEAAMNASAQDLADLEASIGRMKALDAQREQEAFIDENRNFHGIIARASGNKVLEVFWQTISILAAGEHQGIRYSVGNQAHVIKAHQRILDACRRRDGNAAAAAMERHVTDLENLVRARYQHLLKHPTSVVDRPGRSIA